VSETLRYRWASLVIECDFPLPELPVVRGGRVPDIVVRRAAARTRGSIGAPVHQWLLPDGTRWASVAKRERERVVRFQRFAAFAVADGGRTVKWHAPSTTRPDTLRHLLLDQVLPAMAFEHSLIGLHASAVVVGGAGIAFAGPTSRGKSTLAASFAADGHPVVTDDCLMLRWKSAEPCAVPSYPSLRLWKSTADRLFGLGGSLAPVAQYTSKLRISAGGSAFVFRRRPVRVGRIYVIDRRVGPARIDRLSGREAYVELLKTTFHLDPLDPVAARREVAALAAIVRRVPVARLRVPLQLESLRDVRRAIAADLAGAARRRPS
jgi:hypothetical protein